MQPILTLGLIQYTKNNKKKTSRNCIIYTFAGVKLKKKKL